MNHLLTVVAVLTLVSANAQSDFRPGFVVTLEGDTIRGYVDNRVGSKAFGTCTFRESERAASVTHNAGQIRGYGIEDGKCYESRVVAGDSDGELVFVELIITGYSSLYKYGGIYLIQKDTSRMYELRNGSRETRYGENAYGEEMERREARVIVTNEYLGILNALMFDCVDLRPAIQHATLNENSLTRLVQAYNDCHHVPSKVYKTNLPWFRFQYGLTVGVSISDLNFVRSTQLRRYVVTDYEKSSDPLCGLSLDIVVPKLNDRLSFHADVLYFKSNYVSHTATDNGSTAREIFVEFELEGIKIPLGLRYTLPPKIIGTLYFEGGASETVHTNRDSFYRQDVYYYNDGTYEVFQDVGLRNIRKDQVGFWAGIGFSHSIAKWLTPYMAIRYEWTDGITEGHFDQSADIWSTITNVQLLAGIRF